MKPFSVKLVLRKANINKRGHAPIYVRVTIDRTPSYISTRHYIPPNLWDEKNEKVVSGHPLADVINADIMLRKSDVMKKIVTDQAAGENISSAGITYFTKNKKALPGLSVFKFAETYQEEMKNKRKAGTLGNYLININQLEQFAGRNISFEEINEEFLAKYENSLFSLGLTATTVVNYLVGLRTLFNAARKRKLISHYPFDVYEMPSFEFPGKSFLTLEELKKLEEYALNTNAARRNAVAYFLIGCYSGLRVSDWKEFDQKKHVRDGRLYIRAQKNGGWVTMIMSEPLKRAIAMINGPFNVSVSAFNMMMKTVVKNVPLSKKLSSHCGRHTFAITICAEGGISSETCAELMGITIATCVSAYYKVTNRKIDNEVKVAWGRLT